MNMFNFFNYIDLNVYLQSFSPFSYSCFLVSLRRHFKNNEITSPRVYCDVYNITSVVTVRIDVFKMIIFQRNFNVVFPPSSNMSLCMFFSTHNFPLTSMYDKSYIFEFLWRAKFPTTVTVNIRIKKVV